MNTPPQNYQPNPYGGPPPGQYGYGAPPPPRNSGNSCLLAAGITCGVLLLLAIVGTVLIGVAFKKSMSNPNSVLGKSMQAATAQLQGRAIATAVVQYKTTTGNYPNTLERLVSKGLITPSELHSTLDPNPDPTHVSWTYTPPSGAAGANPIILTQPVDITLGTQTVHEQVVIYLDGMSQTIPIPQNGAPGVNPQ